MIPAELNREHVLAALRVIEALLHEGNPTGPTPK
jgi:hypothetical protein